ncbi:TonB-dependent receptor [Nitrospirillum viridazoti Y2]|uniref:Iron complex outermembrane receptor protein n=1 Tax=Nitrospirillum amazonense TaxID=28077 RepID=A0A560IDS5_9PROT|nr:TonB-dependent receptor [Nitrospirillum amazonense]EGY01226.1 TonB-dependent receptor [Nitrospirillum amazonense Y2]TWB56261.1 iron complex outermembrane receptor protein [Nitrospirillum amazonense]
MRGHHGHGVALLASAAAGALMLSGTAWAAGQAAGGTADDDLGLQEIIVTAQKRSENVQDIPKTVNVVTPEALSQAGVNQLSDLSAIAPSLQGGVTGNLPGQRSLAMRGISTLPISQNLPAQVGIVLDDVPQPTWASLANELSDVERIEVLPGPQSTLSGRNAAAGLVNIVTRSPSMTRWTGSVSAEQTDDSQTKVSAFLSGPLADNLAFSLSAFEDKWDGNVHNVTLGKKLNGQDTRGARVKVKWQATDKLTVNASYFNQLTQADFVGGQSTTGAASSGAIVYADPSSKVLSRFDTTPAASQLTIGQLEPGVTIGPDNNAYASSRYSTAAARDSGGTLRLDYDFDFGTLSSLTSFASSDQNVTGDFVAINVPVAPADRYFHQRGNSDNTVQEVRFSSDDTGPVKYLVGFIYSDLEVKYDYRRAIAPTDWYRTSGTQSTAGYARATWQFLPDTSLTGGLRYQSDKLDYNWLFRPTYTKVSLDNAGDTSYSFLSGEASLQHRFVENVMSYVTYAHAESGKSYDTEDNVTAATGAKLVPLASEVVNNVEIGAKSEWFNRRLTVDVDLFHADYDNFPVQTIYLPPNDPTAAPVFKTLAAGKVKTEGVELNVTAVPIKDLRLGANVAYINATIDDLPNAPCYKGQTVAQGCVVGSGGSSVQKNLAGSQLPYSPKWKFNLSANYIVPLPSLPFDADLGAFYKYQSRVQYDPLGNPLTVQGGFGILNLSTGIHGRDSDWSAEFFVNNVFDKHNYRSLVDSQFWSGHVIIAGLSRDWERYMGVRVKAGF